MKHQSKILLIGLIITLLIPVMASAAQTPMDNRSNSSLYSPDSVENYEYQGKIIYPVPISNLDFKSVTASNIQFNLSTEEFFTLSIMLTKKGDKADQVKFNYQKNKNFDVEIELNPDFDYSIQIILENDDSKFSSMITANLNNDGREIGNSDLHLHSFVYHGFQIMASIGEGEPNDTIGTATTVPNDTDVYGTMSSASDVDFFKIVIPVKQKINVFLGNVCSTCDYELYLFESDGTTIVDYSINGEGAHELISNKTLEAGTYYARVHAFSTKFNPASQYLFRWKATQSWPAENTTSSNITSPFGPRWGTTHNGIDISRGINDPIVAAFDGVVTEITESVVHLRGNYVFIDSVVDGQNVQTRYQHLVDDSIIVEVDDIVVAGQKIGTMGTTGDSTGIHLHFETRTGTSLTPVDPMANHFLDW